MPPKRKKRYTQKQKKRTGRKQKNTTFKNTAQVGGRKSLEDALSEKLTDELVQKLIDYPDRKYSILIDFCSDNSFVVNTMKLLDESSLASDGVYTPYNNQLTIPNDFEQGKLLEIIIKVDEDVIQYATTVKEKNESDNKFCIDKNLPVIYHIPEITTLDDKDLLSSTTLAPSISDEQQSDMVDFNNAPRGPMSYDNKEITSPNDVIAPAEDMGTLQSDDLEDVTDDIIKTSVSEPSDVSKEMKEKIKEEELKDVSEKPELKDYQDDLSLLKKKTKDKSALRSREEGDIDTSDMKTDFRELAKERKQEKEAKKKQQENIDKLAHEARLKAEQQEELMFEDVSDDEAKKEQESEKLFQKYTDEINIISGILQSIMMSGNISSDKTHRNDYTPALGQLKTKYEALIDIFNKDNTTHIPKETKETVINVLTNNHRRLQALRTSDRGTFGTGLKFESNFMEKVKDSLSIMNTLKTYFETLDESLMKNFGNKPQVSYDYTKYVDGGKKTRKNRRKTKQRKTKKRI